MQDNRQRMRQIRIRNFGPIRSGLEENNGFIDIEKVTLFIGNQATGKSTVAKLISTFTWLEKALYRGDIKENEITRKNKFEGTYCHYHRLKNYFEPTTEIEYRGLVYIFHYSDGRLIIHSAIANNNYRIPKIMYVPAERNFLSAVDQPEKLKGIPQPLYTFLYEFDRSQQELNENLNLPIGNLKFQYQKQTKTATIIGDNYRIKLLEASSGLQSSVPLFLVSRNLALSIDKNDASKKEISIDEEKRIRAEIRKIYANKKLSEDLKKAALEELSSKFKNAHFVNIVEEIEQNLFPKSQKEILFSLLEYANNKEGNELIMTTHSPYVINYLTLAIKGYSVLQKIQKAVNSRNGALKALEAVVPAKACVYSAKVIIYELEEGKIIKLPSYEGIPSDENYLNKFLLDTNQLFDALLEIEESL